MTKAVESSDVILHQTIRGRQGQVDTSTRVMPRPRNKGCQTDYDKWIEHKIQEGIENFVTKFRSEVEDQMSQLKSEVANLKSEVEHLAKANDSLNDLQQCSETTIEQLQSEIKDLEERNISVTSKLHSQLEEKNTHIRVMMEKMDQLEQGTKENNIKISGMMEDEGEDIRAKVVDLVKDQLKLQTMGIDDIKYAGRMGKKNQNKARDILVKLNSNTLRDTIYKRRKLLMRKDDPVYINEDLTQYRNQLFYEARKLRKRGHLFGAWTQGGNIMVKLTEDDIPYAVRSNTHLKTLTQQDNSDIENDQE